MKTNEKNPGKEWPQILAISVMCIIAFSSGIIITWTSPFISVLTKDKEKYDITDSEASLLSTLISIGLLLACPFVPILNKHIGRKTALLLVAPLQAAYFILTIFARDIKVFYLARLLGGVSDALLYPNFAAYIGEIATPTIRGSWGNFPTVTMSAGMFFINVVGSYCNIQQAGYVCLIFPIIFFIIFLWMPESPYYHILKGEHTKAIESMKWLLRKSDVDYEFTSLKKSVQAEMENSGKWKELFLVKSNRRGLIIGTFLRFAQQFAAITVFESYAQYIFEKSGSHISHQFSAMIFFFLLWILSTICSFTLDKLGRRKSFLFSAIGCALTLGMEATYFYLYEYKQASIANSLSWVPLTGLALYLVFYSPGLAILPTLIMSELFPTNIKTKGVCILNIVLGLSCLMSTSLFHFLSISFGMSIPFIFYTIATCISVVLGIFIIPDTQGKTLEEIQQQLKK